MKKGDFDWVKARSNCTVHEVFKQLIQDVQGDLDAFSKLHPGPAQSRSFGKCADDRFYVECKQYHRVVFERNDATIKIDRWGKLG